MLDRKKRSWVLSLGVLVLCFILLNLLTEFIFEKTNQYPAKIEYGITFSPQYALYLGLDWQESYLRLLNLLKVKKLRIPSYWDILEKSPGKYDFTETDFMLNQADRKMAKVLLVVGIKQPRWPECHIPKWAATLGVEERRAKALGFIKKVVERYKDDETIWGFQVENEPLLPFFGQNCDSGDAKFLKQETDLVKSMTAKKIVVTDSGEFGFWAAPMQLSNIFGTTLYRKTYDPLLGYKIYPILPYLYDLKAKVIKKFFAPNNEKTILVELQAEPWIARADMEGNPQKQVDFFPLSEMKGYIDYAKKTGFDTQYLWGAEWWLWMADNGYPQYLDYAKSLFK